jgi:hypothetical protein
MGGVIENLCTDSHATRTCDWSQRGIGENTRYFSDHWMQNRFEFTVDTSCVPVTSDRMFLD